MTQPNPPTGSAETYRPPFAASTNNRPSQTRGYNSRQDNRAFDRHPQGRQWQWESPRSYGDAWGTSRIKHPGLSTTPSTGPNSVLEERHLPVPSGPRFTYNRTSRDRQYFSEDTAGLNSSRDNAYLSDWASRMGEARSQHRTEDNHMPSEPQPERNIPRYIPPHFRPAEERGSAWRGRRGNSFRGNVGQRRGESHPAQPWRRHPSGVIYPTAISEPDEGDSGPSHVIRDRAAEVDPDINIEGWRGHRPVDGRQLYRGRPHPESSTSRSENHAEIPAGNAERLPERQSDLSRPRGPTLDSTIPISISSLSVLPRIPSLSQLREGGDIEAYLAALRTAISAASNQNNESEQGINDPRVVELLNRLLPILGPATRQRPDIQANTQDSPTPGPHTLSDTTVNNMPRVPPESTSSRVAPRVTGVDERVMGSPRSPHHTDSPAGTMRDPRPTASVGGRRFIASNGLRSSILAFTRSASSLWRRKSGSRDQTPVSPDQASISPGRPPMIPGQASPPPTQDSGQASQPLQDSTPPSPTPVLSNQNSPPTDRASVSSVQASPPADQESVSSSQASSLSDQASPPVDQASASPREATVPNQNTSPQDSELRRLAEEATLLLELCTRVDIDQNDHERRQLIDFAFENILRMRGQQENVSIPQGEQDSIRNQEPQANIDDDSTKVDASCIICYDQIADTVLLPCNHLVLCIECCDKMGIMERGEGGHPPVPCPMCRGAVEYRIKIFRG